MKNLSINWKTTLAGGIIFLCFVGHVLFPTVVTDAVTTGTLAVAGSFGLLTAKDGDVTGIGPNATNIAAQGLPVLDALTAGSSNPEVQAVHATIDKLSTAFVAVAQANQSAPPLVVAAPVAAPAPAGPTVDNSVTIESPPSVAPDQPLADAPPADDFENAVQAEVAKRLANMPPPASV